MAQPQLPRSTAEVKLPGGSPARHSRRRRSSMSSICAVTELLVSADSHVHFTDDWVKARLPDRLRPLWDEAGARLAAQGAELRAGQKPLALEDFVDADAARDPGHFEPPAKLRAMDREGVHAGVIFPGGG